MDVQKLYDLDDIESEDITISLVRLAKYIPDHEFFYKINQINGLKFSRIEDLVYTSSGLDFHFPRFEAYYRLTKTYFTFISNRSSHSGKKVPADLFPNEDHIKFLLNNQTDVEYILHCSELFPDFSVILLPENLVFPMQEYHLSSDEELYQIIQYYE